MSVDTYLHLIGSSLRCVHVPYTTHAKQLHVTNIQAKVNINVKLTGRMTKETCLTEVEVYAHLHIDLRETVIHSTHLSIPTPLPHFPFCSPPVCIMCVLVGNRLRKPRETKTADPCDMENSKKEEKKLESKLATNWIVPPSNGKTGRKRH